MTNDQNLDTTTAFCSECGAEAVDCDCDFTLYCYCDPDATDCRCVYDCECTLDDEDEDEDEDYEWSDADKAEWSKQAAQAGVFTAAPWEMTDLNDEN